MTQRPGPGARGGGGGGGTGGALTWVLVLLSGLVVAAVGSWLFVLLGWGGGSAPTVSYDAVDLGETPPPGADLADLATDPQNAPAPAAAGPVPDADWVARISDAGRIPAPALRAYAAADLRLRAEQPECELSWATLGGIGFIESQHGTYGGNALGADGRPVNGPIVGVALDGEGPVAAIGDTDGGALDGDTTWDRAVGPLQFIPATWRRWGADGDGDGAADPQDIDDAAYSAGRYLCGSGSPLSDADQWRRAILAYNASDEYVSNVVLATNYYALRSTAS